MNKQIFIASTIGNFFEHYDHYLFSFLAPFLAPLFFQTDSPIVSLILTFAIIPLGLLSRPLGALFFGKMGDQQGRKKAIIWTLFGMACITFLMGFLPTYQKVGWIAPVLLALGRLLQNFFAAGETTGGALLLLEHTNPKKRVLMSSLFDTSSVLGILIASVSVSLLAGNHLIESHWRLLYFAGGLTAFIGMGIRLFVKEETLAQKNQKSSPTFQLLWKERHLFLTLCLMIGFSYAIYESATTLMNGYLPFVTQLSGADSIRLGTWILVLDLMLLPLFGFLGTYFNYKKMMGVFLLLIIILSFPFFYLLKFATTLGVTMIRIGFVILGVGFSAPLYAWAQEITPREYRYRLISLSTAIGAQVIGGGACWLSLWIYHKTGIEGSPGLYLSVIGLFASLMLLRSRKLSSPTFSMRLSMGVRSGEGS